MIAPRNDSQAGADVFKTTALAWISDKLFSVWPGQMKSCLLPAVLRKSKKKTPPCPRPADIAVKTAPTPGIPYRPRKREFIRDHGVTNEKGAGTRPAPEKSGTGSPFNKM